MNYKLNQPDVETTTTTFNSATGESITINKTIPSKQFQDIFVTGTIVEEYIPTLKDVKKEWEDKGFIFHYFERDNAIKVYNNLVVILIEYNHKSILISDVDSYARSCDIPFDLIPLISKTIKALEAANG